MRIIILMKKCMADEVRPRSRPNIVCMKVVVNAVRPHNNTRRKLWALGDSK